MPTVNGHNLNELEMRQIIGSATGLGLMGKQSNFDKPEKRVEKLIKMGFLIDANTPTDAGRDFARNHYEERAAWEEAQGRPERAQNVRDIISTKIDAA